MFVCLSCRYQGATTPPGAGRLCPVIPALPLTALALDRTGMVVQLQETTDSVDSRFCGSHVQGRTRTHALLQ